MSVEYTDIRRNYHDLTTASPESMFRKGIGILFFKANYEITQPDIHIVSCVPFAVGTTISPYSSAAIEVEDNEDKDKARDHGEWSKGVTC